MGWQEVAFTSVEVAGRGAQESGILSNASGWSGGSRKRTRAEPGRRREAVRATPQFVSAPHWSRSSPRASHQRRVAGDGAVRPPDVS